MRFRTGREVQHAHPSWYRGETTHYNPTKAVLYDVGGLEEFLLAGWLPPKPFIGREQVITTFGSCFATHLSAWLMRQQYLTGERLALLRQEAQPQLGESHIIRFGEGMVNTFALRQQFEWALENKRFSEDLWYGSSGELAPYNETIRQTTGKLFAETDVYIITLGLSEVWHNRHSGDVFWRAIPLDKFDPEQHGFRISTVEENRANLEKIYRLIRAHRPEATIVFTLSPVPLVATFRPVSCLTANSVSKAILRVAVDELMRAHSEDARLFYWPSYEIVKEYVKDAYQPDNRHPRPEVIDFVMRKFARFYLTDLHSDAQLQAMEQAGRARYAGLPSGAAEALFQLGFYDSDDPIGMLQRAGGLLADLV